MEKSKPKLLEDHDSKGQWWWIIAIRLIGFILFIAPLFLPLKAYFFESKENLTLNGNDWILLLFGLLLSSGGKQIGMVINNVGIVLTNILQKVTK